MFSSMTVQGQACQEGLPGAGEALAGLARFRRELYGCLWRRPDALFELADAVLTAPAAGTLPYLSLEPGFRRGHGMVYQALGKGRIDEERLRDLLVGHRPRGWPLVFAIDASTYPRPSADTSPGREWHPHSCKGHHGRRRGPRAGAGTGGAARREGRDGDAVVAGWAFQWLAQLSFAPGSWTAPQDMTRVGVRDDATAKAAQMIIGHSARLRADGETGIPLYVHDAGYDEAPLTWDLREHLDEVQILVRVRNDRVMYRDPAPEPPRRGRPRKHSADRFECAGPPPGGLQTRSCPSTTGSTATSASCPGAACTPGRTAAAGSPGSGPPRSSAATSSGSPSPGCPAGGGRLPGRCGCGGPARHPGPGPVLARLPAPVSTSSMRTGSPSMAWAGTRPPSATPGKYSDGPG